MTGITIKAEHKGQNVLSFVAEDIVPSVSLTGNYVGHINFVPVSGTIQHRLGSSVVDGQFLLENERINIAGSLLSNNKFDGLVTRTIGDVTSKLNVVGTWSSQELLITANALEIRLNKVGAK